MSVHASRQLILASRSPRRLNLLREHAFAPVVRTSGVDDGILRPGPGGRTPERWVEALAYLKARSVGDTLTLDEPTDAVVLAADTVVDVDGQILGQPADASACERTIRLLAGRSHRVLTGVCLLHDDTQERFVDVAVVEVGELGDDDIAAYITSQKWRGKAGGYNLSERLEAGWPIRFDGDPTSIMGLPMKRLVPVLRELLNKVEERGP